MNWNQGLTDSNNVPAKITCAESNDAKVLITYPESNDAKVLYISRETRKYQRIRWK